MQQRREMLTSEPFAGVVWWICLIDCSALLSRSGKGEFVLDKVHNNSVPTSTDLRMTRPFLPSDSTREEEWEILAPTFDFLREITIQAARIGEICGQIRDTFRSQTLPPSRVQIAQSQQKASQARETLTQRWKKQLPTPLAAALGQQRLSGRARDAYEHVSLVNAFLSLASCLMPVLACNGQSVIDLMLETNGIYRLASHTTPASSTVTPACGGPNAETRNQRIIHQTLLPQFKIYYDLRTISSAVRT